MKNWSQKQPETVAITVRQDTNQQKEKKNQTKMRVQLILKGMKNIISISSFYVNRCQGLGF